MNFSFSTRGIVTAREGFENTKERWVGSVGGKTLLSLISALLAPYAGQCAIKDVHTGRISSSYFRSSSRFRRRRVLNSEKFSHSFYDVVDVFAKIYNRY